MPLLSGSQILADEPKVTPAILVGLYPKSIDTARAPLWRLITEEINRQGATAVNWNAESLPTGTDLDKKTNSPAILPSEARAKWIHRVTQRREISPQLAEKLVRNIESEACDIFSKLKPVSFVGWGTLEYQFGIVADVAKFLGIPTWCIEAGIIPGSIRVEPDSNAHFLYDIHHVSNGDEELGQKLLQSLTASQFAVHHQSIGIMDMMKFFLGRRPRILVLGAVEAGAGMSPETSPEKKSLLPGFEDTYAIAELLARKKKRSVFFKPHPFGGGKLHQRHNPRVKTLFSDPITLIKRADIIVTAAGKLEAASIMLNKPLIRVGRSFLSGCPVGKEITEPDELESYIDKLPQDFKPANQKSDLAKALGYIYRNGWLAPAHLQDDPLLHLAKSIETWVAKLVKTSASDRGASI